MIARLAIVAVLASIPARAGAQQRPSSVDVLLGAHDVLHVADVITTTYDLTRGAQVGAVERNPYLKPFAGRPIVLGAFSSAIDVLQVTTIKRIERDHPRVAFLWSLALVAVEVWATTNNIAAAGEIQRRRFAAERFR